LQAAKSAQQVLQPLHAQEAGLFTHRVTLQEDCDALWLLALQWSNWTIAMHAYSQPLSTHQSEPTAALSFMFAQTSPTHLKNARLTVGAGQAAEAGV